MKLKCSKFESNHSNVEIDLKTISQVGVREKYLRDGHYNSLKVWWARRPIIAMRSLLINEITKRSTRKGNSSIDPSLYTELNPSKSSFAKFSKKYSTGDITVMDVFAGGGSIPFESTRLGCNTIASELNPIASLAQESIFDSLPIPLFSEKLRSAGTEVIDRLELKLKDLYSLEKIEPYVIFWSRIATCKKCQSNFDLRRIKYLSKKAKKIVILEAEERGYRVSNIADTIPESRKSKGFTCSSCGTLNTFKDIKDYCNDNKLDSKPIAICYYEDGKKKYEGVQGQYIDAFLKRDSLTQKLLKKYEKFIPNGDVLTKSGVINPTLYDLKKVGDHYNDSQRLVLGVLVAELSSQFKSEVEKHGEKTAKQIILSLTSLIEFLVDWNSKSTMWIPQNEQTGRSLAGPGVGMKWDYIEVNPFFHMGSNLRSKLERVCRTFSVIGQQNPIKILKGSSTDLNVKDNSVDIVLTDPPYFDSVDYTGLSEFFRPWFEVVLEHSFKKSFDLKNNTSMEAIVGLSKSDRARDSIHYGGLMKDVLIEVKRCLKENGKVFMLYSHKTLEGWDVISSSIKQSGLFITDVFPLEMERIARPRAMNFQALNGVIVFELSKQVLKVDSAIKDDVSRTIQLVDQGQIQPSSVVISLASIACKICVNQNQPFNPIYDEVVETYEELNGLKIKNNEVDNITSSYLDHLMNRNTINKDLLQEYELIENDKLKSLLEIDINKLPEGTTLNRVVQLFKEFESNHITKAELTSEEGQIIISIIALIAGNRLNTVQKRSSEKIQKTARLILSKVNEVETS